MCEGVGSERENLPPTGWLDQDWAMLKVAAARKLIWVSYVSVRVPSTFPRWLRREPDQKHSSLCVISTGMELWILQVVALPVISTHLIPSFLLHVNFSSISHQQCISATTEEDEPACSLHCSSIINCILKTAYALSNSFWQEIENKVKSQERI